VSLFFNIIESGSGGVAHVSGTNDGGPFKCEKTRSQKKRIGKFAGVLATTMKNSSKQAVVSDALERGTLELLR
jgi:hypothetical protein